MSHLICLDPVLRPQAVQWCDTFGLTLIKGHQLPPGGFHLCLDFSGLCLLSGDNPKVRVEVNFSQGAVAHRRRFGGGMGQDIAKAIGVSSQYKPSVVDATAGLGRDTFVLATLGCQVTAIERQPVVAALLADGLERAANDAGIADIIERIHFKYGASQNLLALTGSRPYLADIVYLDPMFDHDPKQTAQVKKDMQAFRDIVGQDHDAGDLLAPAWQAARCRVVVKRARKAEPLAGKAPSYAITGKSNRFDVYVKAKVTPPSDASQTEF
ncbi:MAG: rRNA methyltransferase [Oceanospirillaceae bacterium]|nr:rRNA methyltransferase [Oceanospirillaceae bacterium]MBT13334.1 rRNA methyltransferase [Oceanospirillaceae bacterium]